MKHLTEGTGGSGVAEPQRWLFSEEVEGFAWNVENPRGTVLIQHGYGDHTTAYATRNNHLVPKLIARGFSVRGFDLPGNGRSPGVRGATDAVQAVRLHREAREALRTERLGHDGSVDHGLEGRALPTFLLGHSFGGLVTATSAVEDPTDIAGIVLLAPGIKYDVNPLLRAVARAGGRLVPTRSGPMPAGTLDSLTRSSEVQAEMAADPLMYLGRVRWVSLGSAAVMSHENWKRYNQLRMPLLAIHGTDDANTSPSGSEELVATVSTPDKTLHLIAGARHALLDDLDRDQVTSLILDWLHTHSTDAVRA